MFPSIWRLCLVTIYMSAAMCHDVITSYEILFRAFLCMFTYCLCNKISSTFIVLNLFVMLCFYNLVHRIAMRHVFPFLILAKDQIMNPILDMCSSAQNSKIMSYIFTLFHQYFSIQTQDYSTLCYESLLLRCTICIGSFGYFLY